jgi:DNA-binding transcriptional MerR regulator
VKSLNSDGKVTIGSLAARTGCSVATIRYYEEIGLIPKAGRRTSGHRVYDTKFEELLIFIRRCRDFGFPIEQVRALVALSRSTDRDCAEALEIANAHLDAVRAKLTELRALESSLGGFAASCAQRCAGGPAAECTILKDMVATAGNGCCS